MSGRIWRQGDLLIREVDKLPSGLSPQKSDILLRGEATGHAHRLKGGQILMDEGPPWRRFRQPADFQWERLFMVVEKDGRIIHEEHHTIKLPKGIFQVIRQREYPSQLVLD